MTEQYKLLEKIQNYFLNPHDGELFTWSEKLLEISPMRKIISINNIHLEKFLIDRIDIDGYQMLVYFKNFLIKKFKIQDGELAGWRLEYNQKPIDRQDLHVILDF